MKSFSEWTPEGDRKGMACYGSRGEPPLWVRLMTVSIERVSIHQAGWHRRLFNLSQQNFCRDRFFCIKDPLTSSG